MVEGINTYRFGFMPYFESTLTTGQVNKIQEIATHKPDQAKGEKNFQYQAPSRTREDSFTRSSRNPEDSFETDYTKFLFRGRQGEEADSAQSANTRENPKTQNEITEQMKKTGELPTEKKGVGEKELSDSDKRQLEELKKIDREVRAHEAAHKAAGGSLVTGGAAYTYATGPDGMKYVTGGEVQIDISYDLDDPQATIDKMQQVRRAALAPSDPSSQDRSVAAKASQIEARARGELFKQQNSNSENSIDGMMKNNKDSRIAAYQQAEQTVTDSHASSFNQINFQGKQTLDRERVNDIKL